MPRLIEIVLFLAPFVTFAVWRLFFASMRLPLWILASLGGVILLLLALLLWTHLRDARDADAPYVPATLQNGRIIQGGAGHAP